MDVCAGLFTLNAVYSSVRVYGCTAVEGMMLLEEAEEPKPTLHTLRVALPTPVEPSFAVSYLTAQGVS